MTDRDSGLEYKKCYVCGNVMFTEGEDDFFNMACNGLSTQEKMREEVRAKLQVKSAKKWYEKEKRNIL